MPTRAGLFVMGAPMVLGLAAVSATNNLLFLLLGASLGAIVLSGILSERNLRGVAVRVKTVSAAYAGEPARLEVEMTRELLASAYGLRVREMEPGLRGLLGKSKKRSPERLDLTLPVLEGRRTVAMTQRTFPKRGRGVLLECELVTEYPFGLLYKAKDIPVELEVWVRPRRVPVPEALADPRANASEGDESKSRGVGLEIYGLRERVDRDENHRVHALRSLSLGRDVVLETMGVERPTAWLGVVNTPDAEPESLERALEVAQAVLTEWEQRGFAVGLATAGSLHLPGVTSLPAVLDALARVSPEEWSVDARRGPPLWIVPKGARAPAGARAVSAPAAEERAAA